MEIKLAEYLPSRKSYVMGIALRHGLSWHDAEDIFQDVSLKLVENIGNFRRDSSLDTYVHRIAINTVLMNLRKKRAIPDSFTYNGHCEDGYSALESRMLLDSLNKAAQKYLKGKSLSVFNAEVQFVKNGEYAPRRDFANILGISPNASESRRYCMRQRLKNILHKEDFI